MQIQKSKPAEPSPAIATIKRVGQRFEDGTPHIYDRGLSYSWPTGNTEEWQETFKHNKDSVGEFLLNRARVYIADFHVNTFLPSYPHLQNGMDGLAIHIGDRGRWVEVDASFSTYMGNFHNIDAYDDQILGFNLISDLLEKLNPTILAPRIRTDYTLEYPLPAGTKLLRPDSPIFQTDYQKKLHELAGLGRFKSVILEDTKQTIASDNGMIVIENEMCKSVGYEGFYVPNATVIAAKALDSIFFASPSSQ